MIVPHSRPAIDERDVEAVARVLATGHIAQGDVVGEFEKAVARFIGAKYGVAVSSGTSAIHMALLGLDVGPGDEVVIPSYVCASPYMAVMHAGATPRVADVDVRDFNLSAESVKGLLTGRTKAIVVPHMFGNPAEIDELLELGVPLIEDCAQSLGAEYKGQRVGRFGSASVCSFYATKMMTTGEGGMVLTDDREICDKVLDLREYDKRDLGRVRYNFKMTDMQAALGLSQLRKLRSFIARRRRIASIYRDRLSGFGAVMPRACSHERPVFYRFVILADGIPRLQRRARARGVTCERPVWRPLHNLLKSPGCPNSGYVYGRALSIPIYPGLTDEEVEYVAGTLATILR